MHAMRRSASGPRHNKERCGHWQQDVSCWGLLIPSQSVSQSVSQSRCALANPVGSYDILIILIIDPGPVAASVATVSPGQKKLGLILY